MKLKSNAPDSPVGLSLIPYLVLMAGLLFTLVVCYKLAVVGEAEDKARFRASVQEINGAITSRFETYQALLRAAGGLYAASEQVEHDEFKRFVDRLEVQTHYPGIQGIGYLVRLSPAQKDELVAARHKQGDEKFRVWPEATREEYYPIIELEPRDRRNEVAIGFDMFTDPVKREALEKARDSGQAAISRTVTLVQEIDDEKQSGFLMYVPVYDNRANTSTLSGRRAGLVGFVYGPFRADDFLTAALAGTRRDVDFEVYDGPETQSSSVVFDSTRINSALPAKYVPRFGATSNLQVDGRNWLVNYKSRPSFDVSVTRSSVAYALAGGLLISLLFFSVINSQINARRIAERSAGVLRDSEATVRQTLSDRERAEQALTESEEQYRQLVENANDIVYTLDLDGRITSINKAAEVLTGYTREELLSKSLEHFMTPAALATSLKMLDRKIAGEERTNYEIDLKSKSGKVLTVEVSSRLISRGGKPVRIQGIARDISDRRRAEETLREADQRALSEYERLLERIASLSQALGAAHDLQAIFRSLRAFAISSVPCDGLFVSLYDPFRDARTACYAWGDGEEIDVSELPAMPVNDIGPNSRAVRTGEVVITDDYMNVDRGHPSVIVGPDNGLRPQSSLAAPMAVMGRIVGTIEIQSYARSAFNEEHVTAIRMAANLTAVAVENVRLLERESSARAVAEESNRLKDEFLATVSHELRTPLTAILGWSRMLESGALESGAAARAVETIRRNAKAQSQIIDDILDVSRIITGNLYLELQPIELAPVIESAINVVRPTAEAKGIAIEVDLGSRPAVISGDSNRLQQVIWNLASNAIKFTPSGGRVCVSLQLLNGQVEISVTDTGQGISGEFLPFVFDRFRQADSTTTRRHGGLGLGLAIARHLVEIHGGSIHARSDGMELGSTFTVRLPLMQSTKTSADSKELGGAQQLDPDFVLSGVQVLLVDDDRDTLELLKTALTECRAQVTAVTSAGAALEVLESYKPDVLISDIAMPDSDGYELISRVRSLDLETVRSVPAVAITAYAKEEDRKRALACGYQHYVKKPVELSELISVVADVVKRS